MQDKRIKKGSELEKAVSLIQEMILNAEPNLKKKSFTIEVNKVMKIGGAQQEIDVFVQRDIGTDHEAISIYECKDWAKPVGTQAVQVLSDKVESLPANRGFLVARELTKDAQSMLASRPRLKFIRCTREFTGPLQVLLTAFHMVRDPVSRNVSAKFRSLVANEITQPLDLRKPCVFQRQPVDFEEFLEHWFYQLVMQDSRLHERHYSQEGSHPSPIHGRKEFREGEFLFDGVDVEYIEVQAFYIVSTRRLKIRSQFELEGRGRTVSFESENFGDDDFQVDVVMRL